MASKSTVVDPFAAPAVPSTVEETPAPETAADAAPETQEAVEEGTTTKRQYNRRSDSQRAQDEFTRSDKKARTLIKREADARRQADELAKQLQEAIDNRNFWTNHAAVDAEPVTLEELQAELSGESKKSDES